MVSQQASSYWSVFKHYNALEVLQKLWNDQASGKEDFGGGFDSNSGEEETDYNQHHPLVRSVSLTCGAGIAQLVVLGLAVHSVVGSILLWGHFPVEGIFPLEWTWVQTPFPQKLFRMRV